MCSARLVVTLSCRLLTSIFHAGEEQFRLGFGLVFDTQVANNKYAQSQNTRVSNSCARVSKKEQSDIDIWNNTDDESYVSFHYT